MSFFPLHPAFPDSERDAFADLFMRYLRHRNEPRELHYDAAHFSLRLGADEVALEGRYAQFLEADAATHDAMMESLYQSVQPPADHALEQALPRLRPVLRSRARQANQRLMLAAKGVDLGGEALLPYVGDLAWGLVLDAPGGYQVVTQRQLEHWRLDLPTLLQRSLGNLQPVRVEKLSPGLYQLTSADALVCGHLLHDTWLASLGLSGTPVVMAPSRDLLLVADASQPNALAGLLERAEQPLFNGEFALSAQCLTPQEEQGWYRVDLPTDMAEYSTWRSQQLRHLARLYNEQGHWLKQTQPGDAPYIPELAIARGPGGQLFSYAVVSAAGDLAHWLPRADKVVFMPEGDAKPLPVAWSDVQDSLGLAPVLPEEALPRFLIATFPTEAWLRRHAGSR
ncbi:hypothetical protein D9M71_140470 [compost metagenome]